MSSITIKCPACGGNLAFDPESQKLRCANCGNLYTEEELTQGAAQPAPEAENLYESYHCSNCGAEVVTTETTAASTCYYCHSPVVMSGRLAGAFRPDGVIPFSHDRAEAQRLFQAYLKKKRFVDRRFFDDAQLETLSGVYYPAWYGDFGGDVHFEGTGTRVSTRTTGHYIITTTRYYEVKREGTISFRNLFRKALRKSDRELMDGIQPFDFSGMKEYAPAYLTGFLAEMRDIPADEVLPDMRQEIGKHARKMVSKKENFDSLKGDASYNVTSEKLRYILLPAWIMTYRGKGDRIYYYMMNGQSGRACGRLPIDWRKLGLAVLLIGLLAAGAMCAGGAFLW